MIHERDISFIISHNLFSVDKLILRHRNSYMD